MAVLPRRIYEACERALFHRNDLVSRAAEQLNEARESAYSARSSMPEPLQGAAAKRPGINPNGIRGSSTGDQVERAAMNVLQAEAAYQKALRWAEVFSALEEHFKNKPEARIADAIYRRHQQQTTVAQEMSLDRQSVRRLRDSYVCMCALLAAEKGIITIQEECHHDQ